MKRRTFLRATTAGAAAASLGVRVAPSSGAIPGARVKKAVKLGMVQDGQSIVDKFRLLKDLGFDGVELDSPSDLDRREVIDARDATGLPIHGVVDSVHWDKTLSSAEPTVRAEGLEGLRIALGDAAAFGATTVLLVPAVVNKDVSYDDAYSRSQAEVRKVLPLAEELGVRIAFENVWNGFLLSPLEFAAYIDEFESDWVGAYFDIGNVVNLGWPEQWIRILGPRILKVDVKEYSRAKRDQEGPYAGLACGSTKP